MKYLILFLVLILTGCVSSPINFIDNEAEIAPITKFKRPFPKPENGQPIVKEYTRPKRVHSSALSMDLDKVAIKI